MQLVGRGEGGRERGERGKGGEGETQRGGRRERERERRGGGGKMETGILLDDWKMHLGVWGGHKLQTKYLSRSP